MNHMTSVIKDDKSSGKSRDGDVQTFNQLKNDDSQLNNRKFDELFPVEECYILGYN